MAEITLLGNSSLPRLANRSNNEAVIVWAGTPSSTGRFLVADGWDYLRIVGFDSLAGYQEYWQNVATAGGLAYLEGITSVRREVILAPMPELAVR